MSYASYLESIEEHRKVTNWLIKDSDDINKKIEELNEKVASWLIKDSDDISKKIEIIKGKEPSSLLDGLENLHRHIVEHRKVCQKILDDILEFATDPDVDPDLELMGELEKVKSELIHAKEENERLSKDLEKKEQSHKALKERLTKTEHELTNVMEENRGLMEFMDYKNPRKHLDPKMIKKYKLDW